MKTNNFITENLIYFDTSLLLLIIVILVSNYFESHSKITKLNVLESSLTTITGTIVSIGIVRVALCVPTLLVLATILYRNHTGDTPEVGLSEIELAELIREATPAFLDSVESVKTLVSQFLGSLQHHGVWPYAIIRDLNVPNRFFVEPEIMQFFRFPNMADIPLPTQLELREIVALYWRIVGQEYEEPYNTLAILEAKMRVINPLYEGISHRYEDLMAQTHLVWFRERVIPDAELITYIR